MDIVEFRVNDRYYGWPHPFIEDGTLILLYQDGIVSLGKYHQPTEENPFPSISHPKNSTKFSDLLLARIKMENPEVVGLERAIVLICPAEIHSQFEW